MSAAWRSHHSVVRRLSVLLKNRMGRKSSVQIKPIISGVRGQEQLPVVKENRKPAWVLSWDRRNFRSRKTYFSSSTVLTCSLVSQDRSLCGGIKWMCRCLTLELDYCVPSHQHTINKKVTEPEVAGVYVCTSSPAVSFIRTLLCLGLLKSPGKTRTNDFHCPVNEQKLETGSALPYY